MATLVSPGVSVTVVDESFFIPVSASTVPLFFVATRENKQGSTPTSIAPGTQESGIVRTITSRTQSLATYGVPYFHRDTAGNEFHGDARNEYGLFALNQFLAIGNRAFVIRADVDLDDSPVTFTSFGTPVETPGSRLYSGIGNGVLSAVTATSNQVRPQTITVEITSIATPTTGSFRVQGSVDGFIGSGNLGIPFSSGTVNFTLSAGAIQFVAGDTFTFALSNTWTPVGTPVGNGRINNLQVGVTATNEIFTVTFGAGGSYTVTSSVASLSAAGVVGSPFSNPKLSFIIQAGTTAFAAGDTFTITSSIVTVSNPLGATDAARRVAIVEALQSAIVSNTEIRSPLYEFNLILCPGYPETVDNMLELSRQVFDEAFVIADTPANKNADQVAQWSMMSERFRSTNTAYYYPWCLAANFDGRDVMVAPSGTACATIAYSDNVGYVWTPPAGVARGQIVGVSKLGYYTGTPGQATTFVESHINAGQMDNLYEYDKNVNPLVFWPGRGMLVWGQKTSAAAASSLDRINVVRLVMYLRRALRKGALPFVFEPNDEITRNNLKTAADGILNDIMIKRGLVDYATICDSSNNTPDRIQRNELWLDVAIKPTVAAEFVYIPIRVVKQSAEI